MKLARLATVVSSMLVATVVHAGPVAANKNVNITFDGYCDGMHLLINQTTGLVTGEQTGCLAEPIVGTVGGLARIGTGITILSGGFLYVIDDAPTNWRIYRSDGLPWNKGTYSAGPPGHRAAGGARASNQPD
jgi:hypothetical protein